MTTLQFVQQEIYEIGWVDKTEPILPESLLQDDLNLDDLDFIELIMKCETQFDIALPEPECWQLKTVKDLVDAIDREKIKINPIVRNNLMNIKHYSPYCGNDIARDEPKGCHIQSLHIP